MLNQNGMVAHWLVIVLRVDAQHRPWVAEPGGPEGHGPPDYRLMVLAPQISFNLS